VLVGSTEEVVEVGRGVEVGEGVVEGGSLVVVTGVLLGELLGDGDDDGVVVGVGVVVTGEEVGGVEDGCGDDGALDVKPKVSSDAHISQN
jgi:hypothetical protein